MRRKLVIAAVFGAAALLVGCGGGGDGSGGGSTTAATIPSSGAAGNTVAVTLGENGPNDMYLNPSQASAPAGDVTFVVTNEGQKEHEFVVLKTDTQAADFPIVKFEGEPNRMDEDASGIEAMGEIASLPAGSTDKVTAKLDAGHYVLLCNLKGHYPAGMSTDFEVT